MLQAVSTYAREQAPVSAAEAATVIHDGVRQDRWRIRVGDDAHRLDDAVRDAPEMAYEGPGLLGNLLGGARPAGQSPR
jgi:hypothetical protein